MLTGDKFTLEFLTLRFKRRHFPKPYLVLSYSRSLSLCFVAFSRPAFITASWCGRKSRSPRSATKMKTCLTHFIWRHWRIFLHCMTFSNKPPISFFLNFWLLLESLCKISCSSLVHTLKKKTQKRSLEISFVLNSFDFFNFYYSGMSQKCRDCIYPE